MSAFSNYLEQKLVEYLKGTEMPTAPATTYVEMWASAGNDTASNVGVVTSLSRVAVAGSVWSTATGSDGNGDFHTIRNDSAIVIVGTATASATVSAFGVYDASVNGNLLWWGTLSAPKTITVDDELKFNASNLALQIY